MKKTKNILLAFILLIVFLMSAASLYLHFYMNPYLHKDIGIWRPLTIERFFNLIPIDLRDEPIFRIEGYLIKDINERLYLHSDEHTEKLSSQFREWYRLRIRYPANKINKNCINKRIEITAKYFNYSGAHNLDEVEYLYNMEDSSSNCYVEPRPLPYNYFCYSLADDEDAKQQITKFCEKRRVKILFNDNH